MRQNFILFILLLFCLIILFSSCKKEEPDILQQSGRTLIIYMAGDNDLSLDAVRNLAQIEKGYKNIGASLIVFIDTADDCPQLLEIKEAVSCVVKEYPEFNSVAAKKINEVLQEITTLYPSENYGLVLWSHGTSWLPAGRALRAFGDDGGKQINIQDLSNSLPVHFDFILFDACLMGSVEVAYELRNKTDYILAPSTETIADGFPYEQIVPELLKEKPDLKYVAQVYFNHYDKQQGAYRSATISLVDTKHLPELAFEMKQLLSEQSPDFASFDRKAVQRLDAYNEQYHFDLSDFVSKAFPAADKTSFVSCMEKTVLYKAHTPRFIEMFDMDTYCGLSCYIPHPARNDLNSYYKAMQWCMDSSMNDYIFLK